MLAMRILQVSDIHGRLERVEEIVRKAGEVKPDLMVVAGDITHFGDLEDAEEILDKLSEAGARIFFVSGNCDPPEMLGWQPRNELAENLHGKFVELMDLAFIGVGGGSGRFGTLTELSEEEFERILRGFADLPEDFVLVSHSPPHGLEVDFTGSKHIGSRAIRKFVEERQPLLMCTGHAHEGRGVTRLGRTVIVNAGPARDGFCAVIELVDGSVRAELSTLY
ncbi:MAG: YfcE family phosphodiesterase [Candidatus Wolframiiraptor sp. EX4484-121]|nr:MAG: YfcE family phosphodiesterase [Candidatus Wolframiiraptor sp. EX4484-121]